MTSLVALITPNNLEAEKAKFLSSENYHPVFQYDWQTTKVDPQFSNPLKKDLWTAISSGDNSAITHHAKKLFEVEFDKQTLAKAQSFAANRSQNESGSASEYAHKLRLALDLFGLVDFRVEIVPQGGFNSRPLHSQKKIIISQDIHFSYFSMDGGVRHEMVHTMRYYNGIYNNIKNSRRYLPTEEGLASWCQDHTNNDNGIAQHAIEYLASYVGEKGSLRDIYNEMRELGMEQELAWKRACRHKFGFVDTSLSGDIMKPAMYFANEMKIDLLTTDQRLRLFVGKIDQAQLESYNSYFGRFDKDSLISYFNL
jgi:hypothetical protein